MFTTATRSPPAKGSTSSALIGAASAGAAKAVEERVRRATVREMGKSIVSWGWSCCEGGICWMIWRIERVWVGIIEGGMENLRGMKVVYKGVYDRSLSFCALVSCGCGSRQLVSFYW